MNLVMYLQWYNRLVPPYPRSYSMNNLKFIILDYFAAKKPGFWTDAGISATGP